MGDELVATAHRAWLVGRLLPVAPWLLPISRLLGREGARVALADLMRHHGG